MAVVVDTSLLIDYLAGLPAPGVAHAAADGTLVVPPLVVAEVVTGAHTVGKQEAITIPDAHVAQCALELDAVLLTRGAPYSSRNSRNSRALTGGRTRYPCI